MKGINWLFGFIWNPDEVPARQAFDKFLKPHIERGLAAGISEAEIKTMVRDCVDNARPQNGGPYPGGLLRDYVDEWIEKRK